LLPVGCCIILWLLRGGVLLLLLLLQAWGLHWAARRAAVSTASGQPAGRGKQGGSKELLRVV
jgi:hypothetical protein